MVDLRFGNVCANTIWPSRARSLCACIVCLRARPSARGSAAGSLLTRRLEGMLEKKRPWDIHQRRRRFNVSISRLNREVGYLTLKKQFVVISVILCTLI